MPSTTIAFDAFGGLQLDADPQESGAAASVLNTDHRLKGRIRTRDGFSVFSAATSGASNYTAVAPHYETTGTKRLLANATSALHALNTSGTITDTKAVTNAVKPAFARISTTATERTYVTNTGDGFYRYDSSAGFVVVAGSPKTVCAASTAMSNRLAAGNGILGVAGGVSHVWFSAAGDPTTWGANDFVALDPGDGEQIKGMATWGNYLFVWKQTKMYYFTTESLAAAGTPVFNYNPIKAGVGMLAINAYAVAPEGVYFLGTDGGIWVTNGGAPPIKISAPIDPYLRGETLYGSVFTPAAPDPSLLDQNTSLTHFSGRLYFSYVDALGAFVTLTYEVAQNAWSYWDVPARSLCAFRFSDREELAFGYSPGSFYVARLGPGITTDNSSAISWHWASGQYALAPPAVKAILRESRLWGTGTVTLKMDPDGAGFDTGSALTLGTNPAIADAFQQIDHEGVFFQHKLSGTGFAVVNRLVHYLASIEPAELA